MEATRNSRFGWFALIFFMSAGLVIEINLVVNKAFAANPFGPEGTIGSTRELLRGAHAHGNLMAVINLLYGAYIGKTALSPSLRKAGSWLAIAGAVMMPAGLTALAFGQTAGGPVTSLGALSMITAVLIMAVGHLRHHETTADHTNAQSTFEQSVKL